MLQNLPRDLVNLIAFLVKFCPITFLNFKAKFSGGRCEKATWKLKS
jgi:hypothetical protein